MPCMKRMSEDMKGKVAVSPVERCVRTTVAVTNANAYLPYLAVAVCCAAITIYALRPQRGLQ